MLLPTYPSTNRNRDPILTVLKKYLPQKGKIIETASATGEHIVYFAEKFPNLIWQPSDKSKNLFWAIKKRSHQLQNIKDPVCVDLTSIKKVQLQLEFSFLLNINMIHIAPWEACEGMFRLSKHIIIQGGFIYLYGPYKEKCKQLAKSNVEFDLQLRSQNPKWGIRFLEDVVRLGDAFGFKLYKKYEMPSNNLSVFFKKVN